MDGVQELIGVTVIAATNRPDAIVSTTDIFGVPLAHLAHKDPALMRPGRLDRLLYIGPPDLSARIEILRIQTQKMSVEPGLDVDELAREVRWCLDMWR
jgi:AAA family ATPase